MEKHEMGVALRSPRLFPFLSFSSEAREVPMLLCPSGDPSKRWRFYGEIQFDPPDSSNRSLL